MRSVQHPWNSLTVKRAFSADLGFQVLERREVEEELQDVSQYRKRA